MALDLTNYLIDLLTAKESVGVESADVSVDSSIILVINAVSDWANEKAGFGIRARALTEYRDGNGRQIMFTRAPIESSAVVSTSVWIDADWAWGTDTLVESSDILIDTVNGAINLNVSTFDEGRQNVKITYTGGYATIPARVQQAALIMIKRLMETRTASSASNTGGSMSAEADAVAPAWVLDVLEGLRRST